MTDSTSIEYADLQAQLQAAQKTIEVLKRASERQARHQAPDHFAVRKAMANLQNTLAVRDRELERSEKRYRAIFDHSPLLTFIIDEKGQITDANRTAADALEQTREKLIGSALTQWFLPESNEQLNRLLSSENSSEQNLMLDETRMVDASVAAVPGFSGRQVLLRDVTEQHMIQAQLQHSQRMEAIGQLAGGIAHDINNMLCGVIGFSELLKDRLTEPKSLEYSDQILHACENANELVSRLLAFARRGPLKKRPVDLGHVVTEVLGIIQRTLDRRIRVDVSIPDQAIMVLGDPSQLESVLLNLALNSRDAMPEGGSLQISVEKVPVPSSATEKKASLNGTATDWAQIQITDNGTGISSEFLDRIFEPFFTTKPVGKGTGLGLSAAYGTVTRHQGTIQASSELGIGTTFTIRLPLSQEQPSAPLSTKQPQSGSGKILLIDDDDAVRSSTSSLLTNLGYEVLTASCGIEGLELFTLYNQSISVVLLDMIMPDLHGSQVLRRMRKIAPDSRILAVSGYSSDEDHFGADGFLAKPFSISALSEAIAELSPGPE